jgi:hypothetical protein
MDWQQLVSLAIVCATAILFVGSRLRRSRPGFQKASHCGCSSGSGTAGKASIILRARKDGHREVRVKMT